MGNILAQIKSKPRVHDDDALHAMVGDIRKQAENDAKAHAKEEATASVRAELDSLRNQLASTREELGVANAKLTVAHGERDTAKSLHRAAQSATGPLEKKITQLKAAISLEQGTLKSKTAESKVQVKDLSLELSALRKEMQALEVENAKLSGKLDAPVSTKTKLIRRKEKPIIKFEISNVQRGHDYKITGADVIPVRAKK